MSTPTFAETHNLVAFLEKPFESKGFEQIIDFLNAKPIRYALTVNPTVYASCVKQAIVDKQKVIITEENIRCDLKFHDAKGTIKPKRKQRQASEVHLPSSENPIVKSIPTPSNDPLPSGEDSIQLKDLMIFCTNLQQQVLDLEEAKITQEKDIANLKKRIIKLEKKIKSRPTRLRRLKKERSIEDIDQDADIALVDEARGRMHGADMFGVDDLECNEVFVDVREKIVEKEVSTADPVTTTGEVVTAASVEESAAPTTATTADVDDELTLTKTLIAIKAAKPNVISTAATTVTTAITTPRGKGIVFHEQVQAHIPTVSSSKDKGKAKMIEPKKPLKKKDQIALDEELVRKLEAGMKAYIEEEERIAREKDEANRAQEQAKVADDDTAELESCLEIVPEDDDDVAIEATPLSFKSPTIVDYKIYREGKKSYFKIIRADGNSQNYLTFRTMFKNFNREDLEVLRSISRKVNAAYVQLVLLVYKVTTVFNKVNAAMSRVTTAVRVSTAEWIKWLEDQDMQVNEIY
nr:hypothetical protein [Tanacetum cinerariifolium]